jgi:uncharacterized protein
MQCPTCPDTTLTMADRQGVEIDYCPRCRGVWLDRGELDKLIERAESQQQPARAAAPPPAPPQYHPGPGYAPGHGPGYGYGPKRKYKSWLGEIFD